MSKTLFTFAIALGLAVTGCKKDKGAGGTASGSAGSGSTMASGSAAGSDMAGSSMAGSATGSAMGSAMGAGSAAATGDRPASISPELVALNDKVPATAKTIVDAMKATNGDCAKMAAALDAATTKLKPDTDKLGAMLDKLDEAGQTYYAEKMTGDLAAAFGAMDPVTAPCKDNAAMQAAAKNYIKTLTGEE